jgi:hypothetical protein
MSEPVANEPNLDDATASLYAGPLDGFVARRDALAKELRAAGQREAAAAIKNLRKPSRVAWALDLGVLGSPHALQALDAALAETLAAHAGSGDVRAAMTGLRTAMRELAAHAARAAAREGVPVDASGLATALQSVLGAHESLQQLRRGCLAEVPDSDGLDFLAALPAAPPAASPPKAKAPAPAPATKTADREAAREQKRQADARIAEARARARDAQRDLRGAEALLEAAENTLREVEAKVQKLRADVERAREQAEAAAADLVDVEQAARA